MDIIRGGQFVFAAIALVGVVGQLLLPRTQSFPGRLRNWLAASMAVIIGLTLAYCLLVSMVANLYDRTYFLGVPLAIGYMIMALPLSVIGLLLHRYARRPQ